MQSEKASRHVQWDEEKLKETEKTRGTFEKIDEPKTPYRKNSDVLDGLSRAIRKRWRWRPRVRRR